MQKHYYYETVSAALAQLRQQGFVADFNLAADGLLCGEGKFAADEFDIKYVYRYEGESDPGDEAIVYAIESSSGIKGVLVTGFGASAEDVAPALLQKLHI